MPSFEFVLRHLRPGKCTRGEVTGDSSFLATENFGLIAYAQEI